MKAAAIRRSEAAAQASGLTLTPLAQSQVDQAFGFESPMTRGYRGTASKFDERFLHGLAKTLEFGDNGYGGEFKPMLGKKLSAYLAEAGLDKLADYIGGDQQVFVMEWSTSDAYEETGLYVVVPHGKAFEVFDICTNNDFGDYHP